MNAAAETERQAAAWLARRESGSWSDADQAELEQWITASTANRIALLRLETVWRKSDRLRASARGVLSEASAEPEELPEAAERRSPMRRFRFAAIAAAAAAVLTVGLFQLPPRGEAYATTVGGFQHFPLADGSRVDLNTDSRLVASLAAHERRIELDRGEAFFQVAKDHARPFVVRAGSYRVIAVGTAFSVRVEDEKIEVTVTQGKVRVECDGEVPTTFVSAGQIAIADSRAAKVRPAPVEELDTLLSWRDGLLVFNNRPLAEVAAEFNRYNRRQLVVDPSAGRVRVDGTFKANNIDGFVRLVTQGFGVTSSVSNEDQVVLKRR